MTGAELLPLAEHPAEGIRLLADFSEALSDRADRAWFQREFDARSAALRNGEPVDGFLLAAVGEDPVALVLTSPPAETGLTVHPFLAVGYRTPATLGTLVDLLRKRIRVRVVHEPVPGLDPPALTVALAARGFQRVSRTDMVLPADVTVPSTGPAVPLPVRALNADDRPAIARLLARAYADAPADRTLFQRRSDARADAEEAVAQICGTGLGRWASEASFGAVAPDGLAAAVLVNEFQGPLLTEVMTDPDHRRKGLARRLVLESVRAIRGLELGTPRLVVTGGNDRAHTLYRSLGFVDQPETVGHVWLDLPK